MLLAPSLSYDVLLVFYLLIMLVDVGFDGHVLTHILYGFSSGCSLKGSLKQQTAAVSERVLDLYTGGHFGDKIYRVRADREAKGRSKNNKE